MSGVLSWADFWLWLTSRYPARAVPADLQLLGQVVGVRPGGLYARVSVDGNPHMVNLTTLPGQRFRPGQTVIISHTGAALLGLKGRTSAAPPSFLSDEPGGFVPPSVPSRETPQRPEPGYFPTLDYRPSYDAGYSLTYGGFSSGLLLDDGTIEPQDFNLIDHIERYARTITFDNNNYQFVNPSSGMGKLYRVEQAEIDALGILPVLDPDSSQDLKAYKLTGGETGYALIQGYRTFQEFKDDIDLRGVVVPGIGLCSNSNGQAFQEFTKVGVDIITNSGAQERPGVQFDGAPLPQPAYASSVKKTIEGVQVGYYGLFDAGTTVGGEITDDDGTYRPITFFTSPQKFKAIDSQWCYSTAEGYFNAYLVGTHNYTVDYVGTIGNNVITTSRAYVGIVWTRDSFGHTPGIGQLLAGGGPDDPYAIYKAVDAILAVVPPAEYEDLRPTPPVLAFASPVLSGHSFTVNIVTPGFTFSGGALNDLENAEIQIDGVSLGGNYRSWTAFRHNDALTLVLEGEAGVTVIPDLNTAHAVTVPTADVLADLRLPAYWSLNGFNAHHGHHTFPQDRGYGAVFVGSGQRWFSFGAWDAFRDVSAAEWKLAGLSKPKSRALFDRGQAANPRARTPPRPAHGLALFDLFAGGGTDS